MSAGQRAVTFAGDKVEFGSHPLMNTATPAAMAGVVAPPRGSDSSAAAGSGSSNLSCNTCRETFRSLEELRKHFDSELHIHNIRARVEGQPTMDRAEFRRKHGGGGADSVATGGSLAPAPIFTCNLCKRTYKSAQTLQAHLKSTEHLMRKEQRIMERQSQAGSAIGPGSVLSSTSLGSAAMGLHRRHRAHKQHVTPGSAAAAASGAVENVIGEDGEVVQRPVGGGAARPKVSAEEREADVTPARCFFCGHKSASIKHNLKHMNDVHEFTLPLEEDISNLVGLMEYMCVKVNACLCLVCAENTKRYETLEALRGHMRSANHERIELGPEYQEFYRVKLDDGSEAKLNRVEDEKTGQVVVRTPAGASIMIREAELCGAVRHQRETVSQKEERRMLTAQKMEENAVILKERLELEAPKMKAENKIAEQQRRQAARHEADVSIKSNKLHPKGWDGNALFTF